MTYQHRQDIRDDREARMDALRERIARFAEHQPDFAAGQLAWRLQARAEAVARMAAYAPEENLTTPGREELA